MNTAVDAIKHTNRCNDISAQIYRSLVFCTAENSRNKFFGLWEHAKPTRDASVQLAFLKCRLAFTKTYCSEYDAICLQTKQTVKLRGLPHVLHQCARMMFGNQHQPSNHKFNSWEQLLTFFSLTIELIARFAPEEAKELGRSGEIPEGLRGVFNAFQNILEKYGRPWLCSIQMESLFEFERNIRPQVSVLHQARQIMGFTLVGLLTMTAFRVAWLRLK